jgi:hypothetical protein
MTDGLLSGEGTIDSLTAISGILAPGTATGPAILSAMGAVDLFSSTTLRLRLDGPTPGREYSQLQATGPVSLFNPALSLILSFEPDVGTSFEILTSAAGPIVGTFDGLPEGAIFDQGGFQFQITYQGGLAGNSVVVTRIE